MAEAGVVCIVDDDRSLLTALDLLFRSMGFGTRLYETPEQFLASSIPDAPCCLVLDIRLPGGANGLEFQDVLAQRERPVPIVLMTGFGDIPMTVQGMKAGAVDFLTKPFRDQDMLDAVGHALEQDRARRDIEAPLVAIRAKYAMLSQREREVLALVVEGLPNKLIASEMGLAEVTVKLHRSSAMRKMGARTLADLIRMNDALYPRQTAGGSPTS